MHPTRSLQSASAKPRIDPNFGAATVLVLFSDWYIECRELVKTMTKFAPANGHAPIHVYGLLYSEDSPAGVQGAGKVLHAENEKLLAGTPTLEVPSQRAQTLGVVVRKKNRLQLCGRSFERIFTMKSTQDAL